MVIDAVHQFNADPVGVSDAVVRLIKREIIKRRGWPSNARIFIAPCDWDCNTISVIVDAHCTVYEDMSKPARPVVPIEERPTTFVDYGVPHMPTALETLVNSLSCDGDDHDCANKMTIDDTLITDGKEQDYCMECAVKLADAKIDDTFYCCKVGERCEDVANASLDELKAGPFLRDVMGRFEYTIAPDYEKNHCRACGRDTEGNPTWSGGACSFCSGDAGLGLSEYGKKMASLKCRRKPTTAS